MQWLPNPNSGAANRRPPALRCHLTSREKYENGKANILEYNEARNRYLEAESNLLQARYECLYQSRLLDFYRGRGLSF